MLDMFLGQVFKNMPKVDESKKRKAAEDQLEATITTSSKKAKVEVSLQQIRLFVDSVA